MLKTDAPRFMSRTAEHAVRALSAPKDMCLIANTRCSDRTPYPLRQTTLADLGTPA